MIFERRSYTPRPGRLQDFIDAQYRTGFRPSPISDHKVTYTTSLTGPVEQVVHFWAYPDLGVWQETYAGMYANPRVQEYLRRVRPGLAEQAYSFFAPSPVAELTPHFRDDEWWTLADGPIARLQDSPGMVIEMRTVSVHPGSLPAYWDATSEHSIAAPATLGGHLIGFFQSAAGVQYEALQLTWYADTNQLVEGVRARAADPTWQAFEQAISPLVGRQESQWLVPWPIPQMAPLFHEPVD